jgi:hypothetical protein
VTVGGGAAIASALTASALDPGSVLFDLAATSAVTAAVSELPSVFGFARGALAFEGGLLFASDASETALAGEFFSGFTGG